MAIDIKISSEQTIEHEGKQYKPVAIRKPKQGEMFLSAGECYLANAHHSRALIILREVIPPYRVPTDEDAKLRPQCEAWNGEYNNACAVGTLLAVLPHYRHPYIVMLDGATVPSAWRYCRIPNEQKE